MYKIIQVVKPHLETSHRTDSISLLNYTTKHILMSMTGVHKVQFNLWDCESAKVISSLLKCMNMGNILYLCCQWINYKERCLHLPCFHCIAWFLLIKYFSSTISMTLDVHSHLNPALSLCVLQNLLIKPTLCELLTLVDQLEQSQVFLWINMACQYVLLHAHLC